MSKYIPIGQMGDQTDQSSRSLMLQFLYCNVKVLFLDIWSLLQSMVAFLLGSIIESKPAIFVLVVTSTCLGTLGTSCGRESFHLLGFGYLVVVYVVHYLVVGCDVGDLVLVKLTGIHEHVTTDLVNCFLNRLLYLNEMFKLFDLVDGELVLGGIEYTFVTQQFLPFLLCDDLFRRLLTCIQSQRCRIQSKWIQEVFDPILHVEFHSLGLLDLDLITFFTIIILTLFRIEFAWLHSNTTLLIPSSARLSYLLHDFVSAGLGLHQFTLTML